MQTPQRLAENVAAMRFPPRAGQRLQWLMDRNTEGLLTETERQELETLVELSEQMAIVRSEALQFLGRAPI